MKKFIKFLPLIILISGLGACIKSEGDDKDAYL